MAHLFQIKEYYKNATQFINGLVQGDTVEHISEALKQLVEKYDNFIKEMHVAFIRYMEQLWKHTYAVMVDNWYKTLATVEPTFLKFVHYLETIVWNTSKEFLGIGSSFLFICRFFYFKFLRFSVYAKARIGGASIFQ